MRSAALTVLLASAALAGCGAGVRGTGDPVSPTTHAIEAARDSDPTLFSIFPGFPGAIHCRIPNGAGLVSHPLQGTCSTRVGHPAAHEVFVVFHETWGAHTSAWTIVERLPGPKVVRTRLSGETAPQNRYAATDGVAPGPELAGEVLLVAYPHGDVRICGVQAQALDLGPPRPPACRNGLRAVGVDVAALTGSAKGKPERWGSLYLVGTYRNGTFRVTTQRKWAPRTSTPFLEQPPCRRPRGGWRLAAPTFPAPAAVSAYERRHPGDITSLVYFDHSTIAVVSAMHPERVRRELSPSRPSQLCVVRARWSLHLLSQARRRMLGLLGSAGNDPRYGWIDGAGGLSESDDGQPTTPLEVLVETPALRRLLRAYPPGLVAVDAALQPLAR